MLVGYFYVINEKHARQILCYNVFSEYSKDVEPSLDDVAILDISSGEFSRICSKELAI